MSVSRDSDNQVSILVSYLDDESIEITKQTLRVPHDSTVNAVRSRIEQAGMALQSVKNIETALAALQGQTINIPAVPPLPAQAPKAP